MRLRPLQPFRQVLASSAWEEIQRSGDGNILGIGFGIALRDQNPDLTRPTVMRFYVKRKRRGRHKFEIRPTMSFPYVGEVAQSRSRKVKRPSVFEVQTDVYQLPEIVGNAYKARILGNGSVSTGAVVRWVELRNGSLKTKFGVLTVAHDFIGIPLNKLVAIEGLHGRPFAGRRILQSKPASSGYDVCLIRVSVDDLVNRGIIDDPQKRKIAFKTYADLSDDGNKVGISRQVNRKVSFRVVGTLDSVRIRRVGDNIRKMLHIRGAYESFIPGTSGSIFEVVETHGHRTRRFPSAMQVGADETNYWEGYGQALDEVIDATKRALRLQLYRRGRHRLKNFALIGTF